MHIQGTPYIRLILALSNTLPQKALVLQCQLHNRVENLADVSTRCSGLLQGEEDQSIFTSSIFALKKTRASGRNVGKVFNPVVKLVLENQPFLMPEPAEKPSLHYPSLN